MADLWMNVDTALAEVPVNLMPLIDDTDFKTRETAVAYDAAGMDLRWNFVTTGGAYTSTAVTPTTAGDYDWAHQGDGLYSIEIPASGGASINNDTEGFGWFAGFATGVLPWRGPVIGFRAAGINTALITGPALVVDSVTGDVGGVVIVSGDIGTFDDLITDRDADWSGLASVETGTLQSATATTAVLDATPTTVVAGGDRNDDDFFNRSIITITGGTGAGQQRKILDYTGGSFTVTVRAWTVTPSSDSLYEILPDDSDSTGEIADAVWDEATTGHATSGTFGEQVKTDIDAILADTDVIGALGAGLTNIPWNASWDAEVQSEATDALNAYDPPTNTEMVARTLAEVDYATSTALAVVDGIVDNILLDTAEIGAAGAGLTAISPPTTAQITTAVLTTQMTEAYAADNVAPTVAQALFLIQQMLGDFAIVGTTLTVRKLDGSTAAGTFTLNDATTPTAKTRAT